MAQVYFHCSNVKAELVECGTAVDDLAEVSDHAWQHFESGAQMMGGHFRRRLYSDAIVGSSCRNWLSLTPRVKSVNWRIADVRYATEFSQAPTVVG